MKEKLERRLQELEGIAVENPKKMQGIFDKALTENRSRTEDETKEWAKLKSEAEAAATEIRDIKDTLEQLSRSADVRPTSFAAPGKSDLGKSDIKGIRTASIAKIARSSNPKTGVKLDGVEAELRSVAEAELRGNGIDIMDGAALVPQLAMRHLSWNDEQRKQEQRDITTGAALGAELVNTFTDRSNYIEALRPYNVLMGMGVGVEQNASGDNKNYPRENSLYTAAMAATENAAATESMTATLFTTVAFSPKRATGFVQVSNQMLPSGAGQGGSDLEARVRNQIAKGHATLMDVQGITGSGASGNARGIINTSNVGTVIGGTNGANFSRAFITQFESVVGAAGGVLERCKYATNFSINAYGKRTEISAGSGRFLIDAAPSWQFSNNSTGMRNISLIDQYEAYISSNVPNNLTKGTSSGICSAVIFGDPSDAKYMQFGGMQIIVDPYSQGGSALTNYYVHQWFDFNVLRPGSWAISVDMLTP